ncbi:ATP-binding cassette domain-containing protein, partial [Lysinibacillus fusiformis]|uniref:ATP-binding cassette domain-containing protein n=1 Tax=Lysinibacillus fusiformis TaxID=28031 RepID=UPI00201C056F
EPRLLPFCTLYENVTFSCNGVVDRSQIMNLLARVKLDNEMYAFPKQLSGGMKQLVSIIRAFACKPQLFMMDEP